MAVIVIYISSRKDPFSRLKEKLGQPTRVRGKFRTSSGKIKAKAHEAQHKMNTLVLQSLLTFDNSSSKIIKTCLPTSLGRWRKKNNIYEAPETAYSDKYGEECDVNVPELKTRRSSREKAWEYLDKQLDNDPILKKYPKNVRPRSLDIEFRDATLEFAKKYFSPKIRYNKLLAKISFFKDKVNKHLLNNAVTIAIMTRKDLSSDIPNSIEVDDGFFNKRKKMGDDYNLYINKGDHDVTQEKTQLSHDEYERVTDYYREDPLFHVFHATYHRLFESILARKYKRSYELFFYTHQQMMRRYNTERKALGLEQVRPLSAEGFSQSLGPGYSPGWYKWDDLGDRKDNCNVKAEFPKYAEEMKNKFEEILALRSTELEEWGAKMEKEYHSKGHNIIAEACSTKWDASNPDRFAGGMSFSEVSARDPVFFRWHSHIENMVKNHKNSITDGYTKEDFVLSDGIKVLSINTLIEKETSSTKSDLENFLITHWEKKNLNYGGGSSISYDRRNHVDFKYKIKLLNANGTKRKVFFRLWLGLFDDPTKISEKESDFLIELDQFSHLLTGNKEEFIERKSTDSAATLKEEGTTIIKLMDDIKNGKQSKTWCGIPHHMLLPRSADFDPAMEDLGGRTFTLIVIATDVEDDVVAGTDGVEHMICGHKDIIRTKLDEKKFGFPFDARLTFNLLGGNHSFVAFSAVKIAYRPESMNKAEMGKVLSEKFVNALNQEIPETEKQDFDQIETPKENVQISGNVQTSRGVSDKKTTKEDRSKKFMQFEVGPHNNDEYTERSNRGKSSQNLDEKQSDIKPQLEETLTSVENSQNSKQIMKPSEDCFPFCNKRETSNNRKNPNPNIHQNEGKHREQEESEERRPIRKAENDDKPWDQPCFPFCNWNLRD